MLVFKTYDKCRLTVGVETTLYIYKIRFFVNIRKKTSYHNFLLAATIGKLL